MTATSPTNKPAHPSGVAQSAKTNVQTPEAGVDVAGPSRREFLFYIWAASMALTAAAGGGAIIWFMLPRFKEGEFGGTFPLTTAPAVETSPLSNATGKFWLSNAESGLVALYKVCTHLGCLYAWVENSHRFECPCHGSKYELDGTFIEGPAPRSLDRFHMIVRTTSGEFETNADGDPIPGINPADVREIIVDTGKRIKRAGRV